jgi:uncharacterized protein YcgL (UPF0745 family)
VVNSFVSRIVAWLRAGYPDGIPQTDYMPILALLSRRLTAEEVQQIADALAEQPGPIDHTDIGVSITRITDELPTPEDIERVRQHLAAQGWPLDDPRGAEETE